MARASRAPKRPRGGSGEPSRARLPPPVIVMEGFIRPDAEVLPETAMVPERNLIVPPPDQFTHELTRAQPFYYPGPQQGTAPDGELPAGTRVVLLVHDGGPYCRVVSGQGLYVAVEFAALGKL